jgi:PIN domain nuclease of toxin-antitoxin system
VQALLDTHALLWWFSDDRALTIRARKVIEETRNEIFVSAASAWELATKVRLGKLANAAELVADIAGYLQRERFQTLPISVEHAIRAG